MEAELDPQDKKLVSQIQGDIPSGPTPFAELARRLEMKEEEVLRRVRRLVRRGVIRRFGAILRHQKAGYQGNAMVVWRVPEGRTSELGEAMASFSAVSHCYLRPAVPEWPYNLYTMIHGRSAEDCRQVVKRISRATGIRNYRLLFSRREHKKSSMRYFDDPSQPELRNEERL